MVVNKCRTRIALYAETGTPDSRTQVHIFHVEEVALVHAVHGFENIATNDKARSHDPFGVERLFGGPGLHHQMPLDALGKERTHLLAAPGNDIEHRVETTR